MVISPTSLDYKVAFRYTRQALENLMTLKQRNDLSGYAMKYVADSPFAEFQSLRSAAFASVITPLIERIDERNDGLEDVVAKLVSEHYTGDQLFEELKQGIEDESRVPRHAQGR